ncbi:MAG: signal peptide peptidase SppA [Bacteroidales bacterium]|nr:signal peptide peptidase SppA [Bacteroidales bacterium]
MLNFLKYTLATIVGTLLTFLLLFLIIVGIASVASKNETVTVKPNSILELKIDKILQEREPVSPFAQFGFDESSSIQGLDKIKAVIKNAKEDKNINGIYIDAGLFVGGGLATIEEIRQELIDFKTSGKFIIAYGENYSQLSYYLASVADKVYLNPMGMVDFKGLNGQVTFFKNALDKLEVEMQIIRGPNNKFKSAVEPFMDEKMSEANREQTSIFLGSIWNHILTNISKERKIEVADLQNLANNLSAYHAESALKSGLIDGIKYWDEIEVELNRVNKSDSTKKPEFISLAKYKQTLKTEFKQKDKIAVIYAVGAIQSGEGDDQTIGSERIAKAIREARKDSTIKAVVFRINSPGGSAQASEVIYRELELLKKEKPLVASMGDYAASGGYYIACNANRIFAQPNTLTGSIGVFGMIPNMQKLLNNKLGITFDGVKTAENADIFSINKPLSPYQFETIRNSIDFIYQTFIQHVADGRNMTTVQVDSIGQGRVWSGVDALKIGLVDELGNIDAAISHAAKLAKIENYRIKELPAQKDPFEEIIDQLNGKTSIKQAINEELGVYAEYINFLKSIDNQDRIQARLPFILHVE